MARSLLVAGLLLMIALTCTLHAVEGFICWNCTFPENVDCVPMNISDPQPSIETCESNNDACEMTFEETEGG